MGKFMRKCKGIGEVAAVMESQVGVRTRARTRTEAEAKRKFSSEFAPSCYVHLTTRRKVDNSISSPPAPVLSSNSCSGPNSDPPLVVRCSSDGSSGLVNESLRSVVDPEEFENSPSIEREKENNMESSGRVSSEVNSRHRTSSVKVPTDSEIEDFFAAAEKDINKRFAEKYNYDIEKDVPLEGRYEWSQVKP